MDKRSEEIYESIKKHKLKADSPFMFHCTMCGECCRNREDILLNPQDLFRLAKGLRMKPEAVSEKYCDRYVGAQSRMPIVRLKSVGVDKHCIFLEKNACSVQDFKPTVCAMFPIGRFVEVNKDEAKKSDSEIQFMFTNPGCGDKREIHTVQGWLKSYGIPVNDEFYIKWTDVMGTISKSIIGFEKRFGEKSMGYLWSAVYVGLYLNYDIEKDFTSQLVANADKLIDGIKEIERKAGGAL